MLFERAAGRIFGLFLAVVSGRGEIPPAGDEGARRITRRGDFDKRRAAAIERLLQRLLELIGLLDLPGFHAEVLRDFRDIGRIGLAIALVTVELAGDMAAHEFALAAADRHVAAI